MARVAQKNSKLIIDEQSKEYWRWRDSILTYEEMMLEMLTFDLVVENPYQQLYEHLETLALLHNKKLRDSAWAFCNDSCLTVLPLLLGARNLALAAIFFATSATHEKIDDIGGEPWWKFLRANEAHIIKAVEMMAEFYKENPLRKQNSSIRARPNLTWRTQDGAGDHLEPDGSWLEPQWDPSWHGRWNAEPSRSR